MQIKVYAIDVHAPRWLKRAVIFGAIPAAVLLGTIHYLRADVAVPNSFSDGETLSALKLNANFNALKDGINSLGATVTTLQATVNQAVPAGTVVAFAGATPPAGWLLCDGSAVSRTQYAALFSAIAVTYGIGDAVGTFNLPDLRAAGVRGVGKSDKFVEKDTTITLGQIVDDRFQGHSHAYSVAYNNFALVTGAYRVDTVDQAPDTSIPHRILQPINDGTNGTPRTSAETTGKAIGMNYIIKY